MRQLPLTHTDQCPAKSRESGCRRQPGMPMSSGPFEVSSLASCARNRFARRLDTGLAPGAEERFKPLVPERLGRGATV